MKDLTEARWMKLKAILFLVIGGGAAALLLLDSPALKTGLLLALVIWAFCRAYYFAFYVIEHYVDKQFRFSGLGSFLRWWWRSRKH
ncbi:MAG: hypothetical protein ABJC04_05280 [Verrucomicrobiota bacterium]